MIDFELNWANNLAYEPEPMRFPNSQRLTITANTADVDALLDHVKSVLNENNQPFEIFGKELTLDVETFVNNLKSNWEYKCYPVSENSFQHAFTPKYLTLGRIRNTKATTLPAHLPQ